MIEDAEFLNWRKFDMALVCRVFGFPKELLSDESRSLGGNLYEHTRERFDYYVQQLKDKLSLTIDRGIKWQWILSGLKRALKSVHGGRKMRKRISNHNKMVFSLIAIVEKELRA